MSLSSNLCRIIEEPSEVSKLTQRAIDVDPRMFYKHYFGFVIRLAIANFGKLSQSILATDAFLVDSKELESQYELSLHSFFVQLAIDNSLGHRVLLGDGFIGAIPVGLLRVEEVIENVSGICAKTEQYVENINAKLGRQEVGFRCAVLYGEYYYGRLNLHENAPYITGYNLIKVSRLEEGLKQALKSGEAKSSVILDFETYSNYKDSFEQYFSVEGDAIEVKSKETTIQAVVCKLKNAS